MNVDGFFKPLFTMFFKMVQSAYQGALPEIRACLDPNAESGEYYGPGGSKKKPKSPIVEQSSKASYSLEDAKKLWSLSEELTKVKFDA